MEQLTLKLRDRNSTVVEAWRDRFGGVAGVEVSLGDIFGESATAIVSPANSFGFMDGGIDLVYSEFFGWDLESRLRATLRADHFGELPVGQAVVIATQHASIPYLVSAPTMRIPMDVSRTLNAYLAFRAALVAVRDFNAAGPAIPITSLLCPGLGTAVGRMSAAACAVQMARAYGMVVLKQAFDPLSLGVAADDHYRLVPPQR